MREFNDAMNDLVGYSVIADITDTQSAKKKTESLPSVTKFYLVDVLKRLNFIEGSTTIEYEDENVI